MLLSIQFLEDVSGIESQPIAVWAEMLDRALDILPFTHVLIGWKVARPVLEACREITARHHAHLMGWLPLLTTDGNLHVDPGWAVIGMGGQAVPGHANLPEFTFFCPNHLVASAAILKNLEARATGFDYDGIFLDRIRFPSPAHHLKSDLGCFCMHCQEKAARQGLDLEDIRRELVSLAATPEGLIDLVGVGLKSQPENPSPLVRLMNFRRSCLTGFIADASNRLKFHKLEIGLDCFTPSLANLVGQDLIELTRTADWVKVMSYAHTNGPAGLPFELSGLLDQLTGQAGLSYQESTALIENKLGFRLPESRDLLITRGLPPETLAHEVEKTIGITACPALIGLELVDLPGITRIDPETYERDLHAILELKPDGLALSWDLRHIPLARLEQTARLLSA